MSFKARLTMCEYKKSYWICNTSYYFHIFWVHFRWNICCMVFPGASCSTALSLLLKYWIKVECNGQCPRPEKIILFCLPWKYRDIPLLTSSCFILWYINQPFGSYESLQKIDLILSTDQNDHPAGASGKLTFRLMHGKNTPAHWVIIVLYGFDVSCILLPLISR